MSQLRMSVLIALLYIVFCPVFSQTLPLECLQSKSVLPKTVVFNNATYSCSGLEQKRSNLYVHLNEYLASTNADQVYAKAMKDVNDFEIQLEKAKKGNNLKAITAAIASNFAATFGLVKCTGPQVLVCIGAAISTITAKANVVNKAVDLTETQKRISFLQHQLGEAKTRLSDKKIIVKRYQRLVSQFTAMCGVIKSECL